MGGEKPLWSPGSQNGSEWEAAPKILSFSPQWVVQEIQEIQEIQSQQSMISKIPKLPHNGLEVKGRVAVVKEQI